LQRRLDPVLRAGEQAAMLGVVRHLEGNNVQLTEARSSFRVCRVVEHARNTLARRSAHIAARQATIDAIRNISQRASQYRSLSENREAENIWNTNRRQEIHELRVNYQKVSSSERI